MEKEGEVRYAVCKVKFKVKRREMPPSDHSLVKISFRCIFIKELS